jgi:hypothetical protein
MSRTELHSLDYYKEDDWDGEGAKAITDEAWRVAEVILELLPADFPKGSAMAGVDGSLGLYWSLENIKQEDRLPKYDQFEDIELYLDVRADGGVRLMYWLNTKEQNRQKHGGDVKELFKLAPIEAMKLAQIVIDAFMPDKVV